MSKPNDLELRRLVREGKCVGLYRVDFNRGVDVSCLAAGAGIGIGAKAIDDLPKGNIFIHIAKAQIGFVKRDGNIIATWSGNWSIGSTATTNGLLTTATEFDLMAASGGVAVGPAVGGAIVGTRQVKQLAAGAPILLDNNDASLEINLNMSIAAASITDATTGVVRAHGFLDLIMGYV